MYNSGLSFLVMFFRQCFCFSVRLGFYLVATALYKSTLSRVSIVETDYGSNPDPVWKVHWLPILSARPVSQPRALQGTIGSPVMQRLQDGPPGSRRSLSEKHNGRTRFRGSTGSGSGSRVSAFRATLHHHDQRGRNT
ncbi:uncharacterized protein EI97DRAFT_260296 [Westerdykella ornata]|uniref:Uncharacterized protein n=1 Tax=Westerdykella ornata TaxID=318751 RepID=A0A6A6J927_WESOR|nr:uncharacterized protein EI97DRAFT_260296 [Westerdykella ornata]KAF2271719.1 hypothetical protein EI97DRAFT_260296 [Westerdykella ornata]